MDESEWLATADPQSVHLPSPPIYPGQMLQTLQTVFRADKSKHGRRKLRLFTCACCRRHWSALSEPSKVAVEIAERYADGLATRKEMGFAWRTTEREGEERHTVDCLAGYAAEASAMVSAALASNLSYTLLCQIPRPSHELWSERFAQAALIREIFGNPYRRISVTQARLMRNNETVIELARAVYDGQAGEGLPILADALEEAGCNNSDILSHCRE